MSMIVKFQRKLQQLGNKSICVTIPEEIVRTLNLKKHETVDLYLDRNGEIVIEKRM
jgi:antitoxin component of MazEF toxin-antitoxin module